MKTPRFIIALILVFALALPSVALGAGPDASTSAPRSAGIIVKPKPGRDLAGLSRSGVAFSGTRVGRRDLYRVRGGSDPAKTLAALRANPAVEWAEPDYVRELTIDYTSTPNDPDFLEQTVIGGLEHGRSWYLRGPGSISADTVWPYLEAPASDFPVAVIDSGFYMDHPDKGANITVGKDCFDTYTYATDTMTTDDDVTPVSPSAPRNSIGLASHGTCVAGEIAAGVNNAIGTVGAGYDTPVRIYKVQGICVDGIPEYGIDPGSAVILDSAVIDAIDQATKDGCKVINMSLAGPEPSKALQDAIDYAHERGVLVVAASGNIADGLVQYPAACEHVIAVGSYGIDTNAGPNPLYESSGFTGYGPGLDLLAPGETIWGFTKPDYNVGGDGRPGYMFWNGTSMASPLVAGGAAALWRLSPELSNDQLARVLFRSARDMGPIGYDTENGWGAFNMGSARLALSPAGASPILTTSIEGANRYATAVAASRRAFPTKGSRCVVIATGENWPDALGGAALAGALDCPILLTQQGALSKETKAEIIRLGATEVIVLGGTGAISIAVDREIRRATGAVVGRIDGTDRYDTANKVAARTIEALDVYDGTAFIATGVDFPDALAASPLAAAKGWPIYLSNPALGDNAALINTMKDDGVISAVVLGGTQVVPPSIVARVATLGDVERLAGADRYQTAVNVATYGVANAGLRWDKPAIATGTSFPDALVGGTLQGRDKSVLLLTPGTSLNSSARTALVDNTPTILEVRFLGGVGALTPTVRTGVASVLGR